MTEERRTIYWHQLGSNKYSKAVQPGMLTPSGVTVLQHIKVPPFTQYDEREYVNVIYDKEYVKERVKQYFLQPLGIKSCTELEEVLKDDESSNINESETTEI